MATDEPAAYTVTTMGDKKGTRISVTDISKVSVVAGYFMFASSTNQKRTWAIADGVGEKSTKHGVFPHQKEGYSGGTWILLGYQDIVIHIFSGEDHRFYNPERIWAGGIAVDPKTFHISEE